MPLSSAAASAVQPASVTWVCMRSSSLSFFSPPIGSGSAPAGGGGATRAAMPSSPSGLPRRRRRASAGSRRKAGARATSPASPMAAKCRARDMSRGRAPRPRAAASSEAPASPTRIPAKPRWVTAGSAPTPSPSVSRCKPGPVANDTWQMVSTSSAGSIEPSVPSVARSAAERSSPYQLAILALRSSLQLVPTLRHTAAAAS
eukprot:scaffold45373_cov51-Phaeocystis_antarctica.AAC.1